MLSPESNVAFYIGNFAIKYYSVIMFFAIFVGSSLSCIVAKKYYKSVPVEKFLDILPVVILSAILGARLYYVLLDWGYYSQHLIEILLIQNGGISIHGALLGGFVGGFLWVKKHNLPLLAYADVFAYGVCLGQIIGRLGNYFNIEAFGKPCYYSNFLCLHVPQYKRPVEFFNVEYFHPTFLYEMIWNIVVLLLLFFVVRKLAKNIEGIVFFSYLILYSVGRYFIEGVRLDSVLSLGIVHVAQVVSIIVIVFSLVMILKLKNNIIEK